MKFVFIIGGFTGFVAGIAPGLAAGREPDRVLLDAAVGCLVGALLFRWFWNVLVAGFRQVLRERSAASAPPAKK